jgi:isoleucyl-tRNA synthetase
MKKVDSQMNFPEMEHEVLAYWKQEKIFERSVGNEDARPEFVFYDGPPFATGLPHYGHLVPGLVKDIFPRYKTMRGYRVERQWGWDCHGLPIENIVEKELGFKSKKDIEAYGIEKFNELCRTKVLSYTEEWKKTMERFGRFVDMDKAYLTMDRDYMESIWWVFKSLWEKGLVYESYRTMHICPRCETTLSQQEVSEGYQDVKDLAVTAKFELTDEPGTYVLAWTTTPWTLPGNVALAVGKDIMYVKVRDSWTEGDSEIVGFDAPEVKSYEVFYIVAKDLLPSLRDKFKNNEPIIVDEFLGETFLGKSYVPPFQDYYQNQSLENHQNGWKIYHADFVTTEMGTGIAHEAPAFGEDDMALGKLHNLPWVQHVAMDGTMKPEVIEFAGMQVKPIENSQAFDIEIIKSLAGKGLLFSKEKYEHSYPHCWRCDTPLLNYATSSWFIAVEKIKEDALVQAKNINWSPEHIKEGRFGKWLEGARDWSVSRQRFWASCIPLWVCGCGAQEVIGSVTELEAKCGEKVTDLHKHSIDGLTWACGKCGGEMKRIPDVLDTWFDSGSMPYASKHYMGEGELARYPADFISESLDQTRAWFYYLHVLGVALTGKSAFENCNVNGIVLAEDGKKMSKKLQNYPDVNEVIEKYGADALRMYLVTSPVVNAENLNFTEKDLANITKNTFRMLWNSYSFFTTYATLDNWEPKETPEVSNHVLDRWILAELQILIREMTRELDAYHPAQAARLIAPFVDDLSNWYIRRSRKRFWKNENDGDKERAYQTLYTVLVELSKLIAPFTPFIAEEIYRNLTGKDSVHLAEWPKAAEETTGEKIISEMNLVREIVNTGLKKRSDQGVKVRQPLSELWLPKKYQAMFERVTGGVSEFWEELLSEELNVNLFKVGEYEDVSFNWEITQELKVAGEMREVIRALQEGRKKAGFNVEDRVVLGYTGKGEVFAAHQEEIAHEVLATVVQEGELSGAEYTDTLDIEGEAFTFWLKRV